MARARKPCEAKRRSHLAHTRLKPLGFVNTTTLSKIAETNIILREIAVGIEFKNNDYCLVDEVEEVYKTSGIRRPIGDSERILRMINNADVIITARDDHKLIGFLRALTECCYISDLAVCKDYQGQGIGNKLVKTLKDLLGEEEIQYVLTSAPGATGFYQKIGFEKADKAFVIKRKKN